jgi:50S ribosomal subunit-associated GTPase HflX
VHVWNKRDRVSAVDRSNDDGIWISALTGEGLDDLARHVEGRLFPARPEAE